MRTLAHKVLPMVCGAVLTLGATGSVFASHRYGRQGADLRGYEQLLIMYHHELGAYPVSDGDATWFEKLDAWYDHTDLGDTGFGTTPDGRYPVDLYGNPLIYEPPSTATGNQIVLRSVGRNGIDEHGAGDDWDIRFGPNYGYWFTENHPAAWRRAWMCLALALIGTAAIAWVVKQRVWQAALITTWLGILAAVVLPLGFDRGPLGGSTASIDPRWLTAVGLVGVLLLVVSALMYVMAVGSEVERRFGAASFPEGRCTDCGYNLRGLRSRHTHRCPECGTAFDEHIHE